MLVKLLLLGSLAAGLLFGSSVNQTTGTLGPGAPPPPTCPYSGPC
jgi:hypothetical protein